MTRAPATLDCIRGHLVGLRMPRALEVLEHLLRQLERGELSPIEAIDQLLDEELSLREGRRVKAALKMGRLLNIKTLTGFDFGFQPSLDRNRILTLAGLDFITRHEVVHFLGQPGCGKTHLAIALAVEAVMRSMATRWSDEDIAASLNRMGLRTGQDKSWNAKRVISLRRVHGIHAYRSAEKDGEWLTMSEASAMLGVNAHAIRRLIKDGVLPAEQVVADAPWQIRAADLREARVAEALAARKAPRRAPRQTELPIFPDA